MTIGAHLVVALLGSTPHTEIRVGPYHDGTRADNVGRRMCTFMRTVNCDRRLAARREGNPEPSPIDLDYRVEVGEFTPDIPGAAEPKQIIPHILELTELQIAGR